MSRVVASLAAVFVAAAPRSAAACAMCMSAAFGDRSYTWPYIGLILAPFLVGVAITLVLARHNGWRWADARAHLSAWFAGLRVRPRHDALSPSTNTETT
jgi:hypothetical protein